MMDLELYVADESIDSPFLSDKFIREIIYSFSYLDFKDFLNPDEIAIITPNSYGEIVLGRKRDATFVEKMKVPSMLYKATRGRMTVEEINKFRDKLVYRSEKIEDRERDPYFFKKTLLKIENYRSLTYRVNYLVANKIRSLICSNLGSPKEIRLKYLK